MIKQTLVLCLLGILAFTVGCETPSPGLEMKEMKFAIDSSLIDKRYSNPEYEFSFSPPIHFAPFSSPEFDVFILDAEKLQRGTNPVRSRFLGVFGDSLTRGMLIVSEILEKDSATITGAEYDEVLRANTDSTQVTAHKFLKNGKTVYLFVTRDQTFFSYLLFFESGKGKLVQLNYQIPADVNISFSGAIESSIGTLKF